MKSLNRARIGFLLGAATCTLLTLPVSCGDDTSGTTGNDAAPGLDSTSSSSSGAGRDTGTKTDGPAADTTTNDAPPEAASEAAVDTGGGGADADAGEADATDGMTEAAPDADAGPQCPPPTDTTMARACLVFSGTDQVNPVGDGGVADLDNMGTLVVEVFGTPTPADGGADGGAASPIALPIAIPPPNDAGMYTMEIPVSSLTSLQPIPIDVPVTTAYILTYFIDNPAGFLAAKQGTLTYGMYVGGLDLSGGIQPVPPLKPVTLTTGQGTIVSQYLTAMRRFDTFVVRLPLLPDGGGLLPPATGGDGTGPIEVGVYRTDQPDPTKVFGGAIATCADIVHDAPYPITGFFYTPAAGGAIYYSGVLNDFGDTVNLPPAGAMVSIALNDAGLQVVPPQQTFTVGANDYSVAVPPVVLTTTTAPPAFPDGGRIPDFVNCPFPPPDAGSDAPAD